MRKYRFPSPEEKKIEELKLQQAENTAETIETMVMINELQKIEQAKSNAELVELIIMLGGI